MVINKNIKELLSELLQFLKEREWFEFKENWFEPIALGEYVSALSNAAALVGKEFAYFAWGDSEDKKIDFSKNTTLKDNLTI